MIVRQKDWSLNLEDEYYADKPEKALEAAAEAVAETAPGAYVNIVTPAELGHPDEWLNDALAESLRQAGVGVREIRFIDQCGCGGFVTRVYR